MREDDLRDDELIALLGDALRAEDRQPAPDRVAALRQHVARIDHGVQPPQLLQRRGKPTRWLAVAASLLIAFGLGVALPDLGTSSVEEVAAVEFTADLEGNAAQAQVTGIKVGIGRILTLRSDDLPILPKGDFYEVWFVGPDDRPGQPNRISAGTFHPDDLGRSLVQLTAAVDPMLYPELSVTAEPGDGDPAPTGPEVLRATLRLR